MSLFYAGNISWHLPHDSNQIGIMASTIQHTDHCEGKVEGEKISVFLLLARLISHAMNLSADGEWQGACPLTTWTAQAQRLEWGLEFTRSPGRSQWIYDASTQINALLNTVKRIHFDARHHIRYGMTMYSIVSQL